MEHASNPADTAATLLSRSAFVRAARTNNPLLLPPGVSSRSSQGRRWRDLASSYAARLGDRITDEAIVARLRSVIWLSIEIERLQAERLCNQPVPVHTLLHMTQELRVLLSELGLSKDESP